MLAANVFAQGRGGHVVTSHGVSVGFSGGHYAHVGGFHGSVYWDGVGFGFGWPYYAYPPYPYYRYYRYSYYPYYGYYSYPYYPYPYYAYPAPYYGAYYAPPAAYYPAPGGVIVGPQ